MCRRTMQENIILEDSLREDTLKRENPMERNRHHKKFIQREQREFEKECKNKKNKLFSYIYTF